MIMLVAVVVLVVIMHDITRTVNRVFVCGVLSECDQLQQVIG